MGEHTAHMAVVPRAPPQAPRVGAIAGTLVKGHPCGATLGGGYRLWSFPLGWRFKPRAYGKPPLALHVRCRSFPKAHRDPFRVLLKLRRERAMTVILVTQDIGMRGPQIAASIAAGLGLDLVSQEQLGQLVAARMHIKEETLRRLIDSRPPLFTRWLGERRRLAFYTSEEAARLARQGDVVIETWKVIASVPGIAHGIRVHIGEPRRGARLGSSGSHCQAAISPLDAPPARRWVFEHARPASIVCDLVLAPAPQALENCLCQLRQLALGLPLRDRDVRETAFAPWPGEPVDSPSQDAWGRARGTGSLQVEIGSERMPLDGVDSPEQAIARIEEHLHGRRRPPGRLPLPPDML
jgi:hypothetical protein